MSCLKSCGGMLGGVGDKSVLIAGLARSDLSRLFSNRHHTVSRESFLTVFEESHSRGYFEEFLHCSLFE